MVVLRKVVPRSLRLSVRRMIRRGDGVAADHVLAHTIRKTHPYSAFRWVQPKLASCKVLTEEFGLSVMWSNRGVHLLVRQGFPEDFDRPESHCATQNARLSVSFFVPCADRIIR